MIGLAESSVNRELLRTVDAHPEFVIRGWTQCKRVGVAAGFMRAGLPQKKEAASPKTPDSWSPRDARPTEAFADAANALREGLKWGDLRAAYREAPGPYEILWPRGLQKFSVK